MTPSTTPIPGWMLPDYTEAERMARRELEQRLAAAEAELRRLRGDDS